MEVFRAVNYSLRFFLIWPGTSRVTGKAPEVQVMTENPFEIGSDEARHDIRWYPGGTNVSAKALAWSLAAAYAHCFCYSYSYLVFFLGRRNESFGWGCDPKYFLPTPIPTPDEYLDILEFRKSQLERALVNTSSEWCWPEEWGGPSWNTQNNLWRCKIGAEHVRVP